MDVIDYIDFKNRSTLLSEIENATNETDEAASVALYVMYTRGLVDVVDYDENNEPMFQVAPEVTQEDWETAQAVYHEIYDQISQCGPSDIYTLELN